MEVQEGRFRGLHCGRAVFVLVWLRFEVGEKFLHVSVAQLLEPPFDVNQEGLVPGRDDDHLLAEGEDVAQVRPLTGQAEVGVRTPSDLRHPFGAAEPLIHPHAAIVDQLLLAALLDVLGASHVASEIFRLPQALNLLGNLHGTLAGLFFLEGIRVGAVR